MCCARTAWWKFERALRIPDALNLGVRAAIFVWRTFLFCRRLVQGFTRYVCLTCDFDGTIARDGIVARSTFEELNKARASGRKLILATGRELNDLLSLFPGRDLFDRVVTENGGVLYRPSSKERVVLAEPPPGSRN